MGKWGLSLFSVPSPMKFELLVAIRYLKAKRKQAVISLITVISVIGVAAGVAALIIALAINAGFREDLQQRLLGAQAHISLLPRTREGIPNYLDVTKRVEEVEGVLVAAPGVFQTVLLSSTAQSKGVILKGIIPEMESRASSLSANIVQGSLNNFNDESIVIGQEIANSMGTFVGDRLQVMSPELTVTPFGGIPKRRTFEVIGIFSSGLYELDSSWVYVSMNSAQRLLGLGDVATVIEVKIRDLDQANALGKQIVDHIGGDIEFLDWMSQNRAILQALGLERLVMFITIGLIVLVAALNIAATLIMMVLEKTRDIAILMSMGATGHNIRRIFMLQGVVIGVVGTAIGLVVGNIVCHFADTYHLVSLAPDVYSIAYVPFKAQWLDSVIVAVSAILISFVATLYPSAAAAKLQPVEALRYE
jgi:lipoprotein-releasing system permease protein